MILFFQRPLNNIYHRVKLLLAGGLSAYQVKVVSVMNIRYQRFISLSMGSWIQRSMDTGPWKTCQNTQTGSKYWSSEYLNMHMKCRVSLKRKRIHTQGFELGSVSLDVYPLPRSTWVRWPGLDGLWSASPGRWRYRRELCCYSCCQRTETVTPDRWNGGGKKSAFPPQIL